MTEPTRTLRLVFYRDSVGDHRWRLEDPLNGAALADSGQGYGRLRAAITAAALTIHFEPVLFEHAHDIAESSSRFVVPAAGRDLMVVMQP